MTTFALIHGSGDGGDAWHLVRDALRGHGHEALAPDLPTDRDDATWDDCVDTVVQTVGEEVDVVVGHSAGGFVVPLVAERLGARLQVFLAGMVPRPGETAEEWFGNVGWSQAVTELAVKDGGRTGSSDPVTAFFHDVPTALATTAMANERPAGARLGRSPWPAAALPAIPARYVVTTRDRFIPAPVQRRVAARRLGITRPDEIESGHCPHLSRPDELAGLLARLAGPATRRGSP